MTDAFDVGSSETDNTRKGALTMILTSRLTAAFAVVLFVVVAPLPAEGQGQDWARPSQCTADRLDCFQIYNGCSGMDTAALVFVDDDDVIGLSLNPQETDVVNYVERRLRAAGLYRDDGRGEVLFVSVYVDSRTVAIQLSFLKPMLDQFGVNFVAPAWDTIRVGNTRRDRFVAIEQIRVLLALFMDRYLEVNGPACGD